MNKQEAIELVKNTSYSVPIDSPVKHLTEDTVINIIKQLDEPEKATVPDFVAKYIEESREFDRKLNDALSYSNTTVAMDDWFEENEVDNTEIFAKAWLHGYEVEKEKLYTVEIPDPNASGYGKTFLGRDDDGKVVLSTWTGFSSIEFADDWKQSERAQLTEDEIKKGFTWAWNEGFAEEVKE
ncbi:hypothetical protein [Streptococcus phage D4446]|nr:hypothetical protein [Streptococcus phage D4446]